MLRLLAAAVLAASATLVPTAQATPDWHVGTPPLTTPWTDDVSPTNLNSRLQFTPEKGGAYRLVVTAFQQGGVGAYALTIREFRGGK